MSDYKRFISYIYEYIEQKKAANRGFVKVEMRSGVCRLQFQVNVFSLPQQGTVQVYGYRHQDGSLSGHLLGELHATRSGIYECITTPEVTPAFDGLILLDTSEGRFFATQWNDITVVPSHFSVNATDTHLSSEISMPDSSDNTPPSSDAVAVKNDENNDTIKSKTTQDAQVSSHSKASAEPEMTTMAIDTPDVNIADLSTAAVSQNPPLWEQLAKKHPHIHPFDDDEISDCLQIKMQDFPSLRDMGFQLSCNRFLCQSFQTHQHLLLGCMNTGAKKCCILGVPGIYNEQEMFFAQLYGFCHFKAGHPESGDCTCKRGGYWYRPLSCCNQTRLFGC